jgi:hypothetical protein
MMSSWAVETSRSTADWASSGSASWPAIPRGAVRGDHGGGPLVAFDGQLVEVGGLGGAEGLEREVVEDEQLDGGETAHLVVEGVVEPGGLEPPLRANDGLRSKVPSPTTPGGATR